mgnify:CR=1 FL=1
MKIVLPILVACFITLFASILIRVIYVKTHRRLYIFNEGVMVVKRNKIIYEEDYTRNLRIWFDKNGYVIDSNDPNKIGRRLTVNNIMELVPIDTRADAVHRSDEKIGNSGWIEKDEDDPSKRK